MPDRSPSLPLYAGMGTVAGFFSALFGVGGGILIVPMLMALARYAPKRATATSLAAILCTAVFGAVRYEWSGQVRWAEAAAIGIPACLGVLIGTSLQARLSSDRLTFMFTVLMAAVGVRLVIG